MAERPILFSGPMVRAILAGTKTVTRREVTPSRSLVDGSGVCAWPHLDFDGSEWVDQGPSPAGNPGPYLKVANVDGERRHRVYPRYQVGDLLWVKETHASNVQAGLHPADAGIVYRATDPDWSTMAGWKWKPSIFMRRADSRITLRVTSVRVERVQDISEDDARAEGVSELPLQEGAPGAWWRVPGTGMGPHHSARAAFKALWESINGAESWEANPFVWVVGFERVTP